MHTEHSYNVQLAIEVGMEKALILGRILYFVKHNKRTVRNHYDGKFWMYDTSEAFEREYPYLKAPSIRRWLNQLEAGGWISSTTKYNKRRNDKTKWYTIGKTFQIFLQNNPNLLDQNDQELSLLDQNDQTIDQNDQTIDQNDQTIDQNDHTLPVVTSSRPVTDQLTRSVYYESFWKEYPNPAKEGRAWDEWQRLQADDLDWLRTRIMTGLQNWKKSKDWKKENGRYVPHAHNWLRDRRWEEIPEAAETTNESGGWNNATTFKKTGS